LGNRYKEETEIKVEQLKAEIENVKSNGDKIMQILQDLMGQRMCADSTSKEGKPRSAAIEEDWIEDEVRAAVKKGWE